MATEKWAETRTAKQCGNSAHILLPKRFRGNTFRVELDGAKTLQVTIQTLKVKTEWYTNSDGVAMKN